MVTFHTRPFVNTLWAFLFVWDLHALQIPGAYGNLYLDDSGLIADINATSRYRLKDETPAYTLAMVRGDPVGTGSGFRFAFKDIDGHPKFSGGRLFYALADLKEKYPRAKWKRSTEII